MFSIQHFCLHGILPFSMCLFHLVIFLIPLDPEIESFGPTAKCKGRKSFDTWYYIVICVTVCVSFHQNRKQLMFFQNILKLKARDQSIQARKKLFCHVIVNNHLCNISCEFLIKIESTWRREIKEQTPQLTLLYYGRTARNSHRRCSIRKLLLNILQYPQERSVLESIFKKVADL